MRTLYVQLTGNKLDTKENQGKTSKQLRKELKALLRAANGQGFPGLDSFLDPPEVWLVPAQLLRLPYSAVFEQQMREIRAQDPSRLTRFTLGDQALFTEELELLERLLNKLRGYLDAERGVLKQNSVQLARIAKLKRILEIVDDEHVDRTSPAAVELGKLYVEVEGLERRARDVLIEDVHKFFPSDTEVNRQRNEARRILALLENEELIRIVQLAVDDPSLVPNGLMSRLFRALTEAAKLLRLSPLSDDLREGHLLPALHAFSSLQVPGLADAVAAIQDSNLRAVAASKWEQVLDGLALRDPAAGVSSSLLAVAARGAQVYTASTDLVVQVTGVWAAELISRAYVRSDSGMGVAGLFVRMTMMSGAITSSPADASTFLNEFAAAFDQSDPKARLKSLKELDLQDQVFNGSLGTGLKLLANTALFCTVLVKDRDASWKDSLELASAALSTGEAAAEAFALAMKFRQASKGRAALEVTGKAMGRVAAVLGLVVSIMDLGEHLEKHKYEDAIIDVVAIAGSVFTIASWVVAVELAATLGLIGAVLSAVVLAAVFLKEVTTEGTQALFDAYFEAITADDSPLMLKTAGEALKNSVELVRGAFAAARSADSFRDPPTSDILRVFRLGLVKDDCRIVFGPAAAATLPG